MESDSSEDWLDQVSERFKLDGYSLSADVCESDSSSSFSCNRCYDVSTSFTSSPFAGPESANCSVSPLPIPVMLPVIGGRHVVSLAKKSQEPEIDLSEVELMKERFAKLLLGEDMSGGGKGLCTALAISNAITNLSASVFGELWKLEPLAPQKKTMWRQEMEWLLCVSDFIVELVPSMQDFPGGRIFEVMVSQPRSDLYVNLSALKKLDAMLLSILDGFCNADFHYVDRGIVLTGADGSETFPMSSFSGTSSIRHEEKWWLPFPKVPPSGLSGETRKRLQQCKECTNQILKAAKAINSSVLAEMEIPNAYFDSLPKVWLAGHVSIFQSGKACLGEIMYRHIVAKHFSPDCILDFLDFSSEYSTLEIASRIEASAHIWRQKCLKRHLVRGRAGRSSWGGKVKGFTGETLKRTLLVKRAEILLHKLRLRFPGLPQTALDMSKIQYNKDVGHAIIESYSRVMESLAFNIMARIDDLLYVDDATKQRATAESTSRYDQGRFGSALSKQNRMSPSPFSLQHGLYASPYRMANLHSSNEINRVPN